MLFIDEYKEQTYFAEYAPSIFDDDDGLEDKQAVSKNNTPIRGNLADFYDLV